MLIFEHDNTFLLSQQYYDNKSLMFFVLKTNTIEILIGKYTINYLQ